MEVDDRPVTYDPDLVYDWPTATWIANDSRGGARWKNNLIVIAQNTDGDGRIYVNKELSGELKDSYNDEEVVNDWLYVTKEVETTYLAGQTFTPTSTYKISGVKLLLAKSGTIGNLTASVMATDEFGLPTGEALATGVTNGNNLTEDNETGEWVTFVFNGSPLLTEGTVYAIVVTISEYYGELYLLGEWDGAVGYASGNGIDGYITEVETVYDSWEDMDILFEIWGV